MSSTTLRIKELADKKNISIRQLEQLCELNEGVLKMALRNNGSISADNIGKILTKITDINATWLLTGNGEMLAEPSSILSIQNWNVTIIETRASAGLLTNASQIQEIDGDRVLMPNLPKNEGPYIGLYVEGDSMKPEYNHGDLVVCKRLLQQRDFRSDRVYIVVTPSDVMLKMVREIHSPASEYFGHLELKSINEPLYERQYLPLAGDMQYQLYSVVAHCRYFR